MGDNTAGDLEARNIALSPWRWIDTFALQAIGTIDARRGDFDQDLAGPRSRHRRLAYSDNIRAALAFEIDLPHHKFDFSATHRLNPETHSG
jgi:hypothetical protein